jgi:hypothetical protein
MKKNDAKPIMRQQKKYREGNKKNLKKKFVGLPSRHASRALLLFPSSCFCFSSFEVLKHEI